MRFVICASSTIPLNTLTPKGVTGVPFRRNWFPEIDKIGPIGMGVGVGFKVGVGVISIGVGVGVKGVSVGVGVGVTRISVLKIMVNLGLSAILEYSLLLK